MLAEQLAKGRSRGVAEMLLEGRGGPGRDQLNRFHDGRCALCGRRPYDGRLVDDHCHRTGIVRGLLDRRCNIREGSAHASSAEVLAYRSCNPATILGCREFYVGRGWPEGWWEDLELARALTHNPAWSADVLL